MLLGEQTYQHSYPYCWRSKTPIIFRAVEQFFIRIDDLRAQSARGDQESEMDSALGRESHRRHGGIAARLGDLAPAQLGRAAAGFLFAERRGHPESEWIRKLADLVAQRGSNVWFELDDAALARELGLPEGTTHRNDTIDVWIDSRRLAIRRFCAKRPELRDPADMYLEATDQHRGWFQSSLMTSVALHDRAPYKTCVTHGFVVDVDGKKISKSSSYNKPMDAGHFVGRHGADIVRLWVSSINYTDDVPFSEEMFTRLGDTYRRIRNTLRILLGNLSRFPNSRAADQQRRPIHARRSLDSRSACRGDRGMPRRLCGLRISQGLSRAQSILRGRSEQPLRRYHQGPDVLRRAGFAAPPGDAGGDAPDLRSALPVARADPRFHRRRSVGLSRRTAVRFICNCFPKPQTRLARMRASTSRSNELLKLRGVIGQAVEKARQEKLIGNALEAAVVLRCDETRSPAISHEELEEFFILSDLKIEVRARTGCSLDLEDAASKSARAAGGIARPSARARRIPNCAIAAKQVVEAQSMKIHPLSLAAALRARSADEVARSSLHRS